MRVFGMTHNIAGALPISWAPGNRAASGGAIMSFAIGVALDRSEVRQLQAAPALPTA
jgi:hypothetical protein